MQQTPIFSALITVASPEQPTEEILVRCSTPRPIHRRRCCLLSTCRRLSGTRFDDYSSGSTFDFRLGVSIPESVNVVKPYFFVRVHARVVNE